MCVCCKEKNFIRNSISSHFFKFLFFFFLRHIEIPIAAAGGFFFPPYLLPHAILIPSAATHGHSQRAFRLKITLLDRMPGLQEG